MKGTINLEGFNFYAGDPADLLKQGRNLFKTQYCSVTRASLDMKAKLIEIMEKLE